MGAGRKQRLGCVLNKTTAFLLLHPTPGSLGVKLPEVSHGGSQEHLLAGEGDLEGCPVEGSPPWMS